MTKEHFKILDQLADFILWRMEKHHLEGSKIILGEIGTAIKIFVEFKTNPLDKNFELMESFGLTTALNLCSCGGSGIMGSNPGHPFNKYYIYCIECKAETNGATPNEIVLKWNTRK